MEIINKKDGTFQILKLLLLESFVMFTASTLCGWMISSLFPDWLVEDVFFYAKASIIGLITLGWLMFYPKCICSHNWGLVLIAFLGGIVSSLFFNFYGTKFCFIGYIVTCGFFGLGVWLGKIFRGKISYSCFLYIVAGILSAMVLYYFYMVYRCGTFYVYQPLYMAFVLLALAHLVLACSNIEKMADAMAEAQEKKPQNRYVILFYLDFLALGTFIEASRIVILVYYHLVQVLHFQKY